MSVNRCKRCLTRAVMADPLDGWLCLACGAIPGRSPGVLVALEAEATERQKRQADWGKARRAHRTVAA